MIWWASWSARALPMEVDDEKSVFWKTAHAGPCFYLNLPGESHALASVGASLVSLQTLPNAISLEDGPVLSSLPSHSPFVIYSEK